MYRTTTLLLIIRRTIKLYDSILKPVCEKYRLTMIETNIISFLQNNPGKDTAADISELRMLTKGNVSKAVESLIQKGLLKRTPDMADRRKVHLSLLPEARPITDEIEGKREIFREELFSGFSRREQEEYARFNDRILKNILDFENRGEQI